MEPHPDQTPSPDEEQTEVMNEEPVDDVQIVVLELPQWAAKGEEEENVDDTQEQNIVPEFAEEPVHVEVEPVKEVETEKEEKLGPEDVPKKSDVEELTMQMHQVKFSDSLILTSFKSPPPKEEKKEQLPLKPILKPATNKTESLLPRRDDPKVTPTPQKRVTPAVERKVAGTPPLVKPSPAMPVKVVDDIKTEKKEEEKQPEEAKMAEEKTQEPPKLEPEM